MYLIFRKGKEMRTKENKGVTLIALAVTIDNNSNVNISRRNSINIDRK